MVQTEFLKKLLSQNLKLSTNRWLVKEEMNHSLNEDVKSNMNQSTTATNNLLMDGTHGIVFDSGGGGFNIGGLESSSDDEKYFETCFLKLLESYERMNGNERPKKNKKSIKFYTRGE